MCGIKFLRKRSMARVIQMMRTNGIKIDDYIYLNVCVCVGFGLLLMANLAFDRGERSTICLKRRAYFIGPMEKQYREPRLRTIKMHSCQTTTIGISSAMLNTCFTRADLFGTVTQHPKEHMKDSPTRMEITACIRCTIERAHVCTQRAFKCGRRCWQRRRSVGDNERKSETGKTYVMILGMDN